MRRLAGFLDLALLIQSGLRHEGGWAEDEELERKEAELSDATLQAARTPTDQVALVLSLQISPVGLKRKGRADFQFSQRQGQRPPPKAVCWKVRDEAQRYSRAFETHQGHVAFHDAVD